MPGGVRVTTCAVIAVTGMVLQGCATAEAPSQSTLTVFAAASLTGAFDDIAAAFEQRHPGVQVVLNYGGSSALSEQIIQGAPADVFAAADERTMTAAAGVVVGPVRFATNQLALIVPPGNPGGVGGLADLAEGALVVALCASEVPCGAASAQLLRAAGVTPSVDTYEQDVRGVLTKVQLGEVDAGLVYVTGALAAGDDVERVPVPEAVPVSNRYLIGTVRASPTPDVAMAFVRFVTGSVARRILQERGFGAP